MPPYPGVFWGLVATDVPSAVHAILEPDKLSQICSKATSHLGSAYPQTLVDLLPVGFILSSLWCRCRCYEGTNKVLPGKTGKRHRLTRACCFVGKLEGSCLFESDIATVGWVSRKWIRLPPANFTSFRLQYIRLLQIIHVAKGRSSGGTSTTALMATPSIVQWRPKVRIFCFPGKRRCCLPFRRRETRRLQGMSSTYPWRDLMIPPLSYRVWTRVV